MTGQVPDRTERGVRDREARERKLRKRLTLLHGIANELSMAHSVDECCQRAVELARRRLGFARVGVWFGAGGAGEVTGSYGVDETGDIRDERRSKLHYVPGSAMGLVMAGKKQYVLQRGVTLLDDKGNSVGTGSTIVAALWAGNAVTGFVCVDTLTGAHGLDDADGQVLALFASDLGYLCSMKRTEVALRESEQNFRALAGNVNEAILIDRAGNHHLYANRQAVKLTGYSERELLRLTMADLIAPRDRDRVLAYTERRMAGEAVPDPYETIMVDKRGREIPVEVTGSVTQWHGKTATIGVVRDVSQRKQAEEALRRSQDMLTRAQGLANAGSWDWDLETNKVLWSRQMYKLYGLSPRSFEPTLGAVMERLPRRDVQRVEKAARDALAGEAPFDVEHRVVMPDGTQRVHISRGEVIHDAQGRPVRVAGSAVDITERRRLEREILEISGREQRRIGQDLHDTLGQELAGIGFLCKALQRSLAAGSPREAADAARINALVVQAVEHTRRLAEGIFPVAMEEEGLGAALRAMARRTEQVFQVECRCRIVKPDKVFDNLVATHVYYIAQEAVTNAVRHGRSTRIAISLTAGPRVGRLIVRNDGRKLVLPVKPGDGMGLRIMRYRADVIGGTVRLAPLRSGGAALTCRFENRRPQRDG